MAAATPAELVTRARLVILAVPTAETRNAVRALHPHLTPDHLVMDVGSIKQGAVQAMSEVFGRRIPWVATHPLFGSSTIALGERPLLAVVCPNALHPGAAEIARVFYERIGCVVSEQDAAEHDHAMARSHALAFFVAKALMDMGAGAGLPFTPPSFQAMAKTIELVRTDSAHLFLAIERKILLQPTPGRNYSTRSPRSTISSKPWKRPRREANRIKAVWPFRISEPTPRSSWRRVT